MNLQKISTILIVALLMGMVSAPASFGESNNEKTKIKSDGKNICSVSETDYSSKTYEEKIYLVKFCNDIEKYPPLGIHVLKKKGIEAKEFDVLLPGTGLNSTTNFFENEKISMAEFLADQDILVIGVDYREYNIDIADYNSMATMDLSQHTDDLEKIVKLIQKETKISQYSIAGHSLGGLIGLDYASKHSGDKDFLGLYVMDIAGTLNASKEPELVQSQRNNYNDIVANISTGQTANFEMLGLAMLAFNARTIPGGDSGVENLYKPGSNLTNYDYFLSAAIYTGQLPGNEIFVQGFFAGDLFKGSLNLTPIETVYNIASQGKIYPLKINEDIFGIYAGVPGSYQIKWKNIKVPVQWKNFELGIGFRGEEAANLIKQGGNKKVIFGVVPGYAHADGVYSLTAEKDVWKQLFKNNYN